jgi:hypothetical protein
MDDSFALTRKVAPTVTDTRPTREIVTEFVAIALGTVVVAVVATDLFERGVGIIEAKQWDAAFNIQFSEQRPYRNASLFRPLRRLPFLVAESGCSSVAEIITTRPTRPSQDFALAAFSRLCAEAY